MLYDGPSTFPWHDHLNIFIYVRITLKRKSSFAIEYAHLGSRIQLTVARKQILNFL